MVVVAIGGLILHLSNPHLQQQRIIVHYKFYFLFIHASARTNITTHLNLLSSKIPRQLTPSSSASTLSFLPRHLKTLLPHSNIDVLTDTDVDSGSLIFVKNGITSDRHD